MATNKDWIYVNEVKFRILPDVDGKKGGWKCRCGMVLKKETSLLNHTKTKSHQRQMDFWLYEDHETIRRGEGGKVSLELTKYFNEKYPHPYTVLR